VSNVVKKGAQHWPTTRVTLLSQIQDGKNHTAWQTFVDLYSPLILQYCLKRGLQDADARDVVQDVFVRLSRAIRNFEYSPEKGRFRSWLGLMTHQQIIRYWSKDKRILRGIGGGIGDQLCESMEGEVDPVWVDTFNAYIYRLAWENIRGEFDEASWRMFELVWEGGRTPQDASREIGCSPQAVYQAKFRVMQRLRAEVWRLSEDAVLCRMGSAEPARGKK
jgi:RNA polymerase sigma factor (sigma-70 family)